MLDNSTAMLDNSMRRLLVVLAGGGLLVATVALASSVSATNSHHDSAAKSGRLEDGCRTFELSGTTLETRCNKVSVTGITEVKDDTELYYIIDVDEACYRWQHIKPKSDGVTVGYKCRDGNGPTYEIELNDFVQWDALSGKTSLKPGVDMYHD